MSNGNSKRERVDMFIRRAVLVEVQELAFRHPKYADMLRDISEQLRIGVAANITYDSYRMKELQDIMDWKRPPREKE